MPSIRVLNVYDNGSLPSTDLVGGKGQAFVVDVDGKRILFDTGMRGRYLMHNLGVLKVKAESIDMVVISHGHYDHAGGLPAFLEAREEPVDVLVHPLFHRKRARGVRGLPLRPIGPPRLMDDQAEKARFVPVDEWTSISDHAVIATAPPRKDKDAISARLLVKDPEGWRVDTMDDELSLVLSTDKGLAVVTGCCHRGILNLLTHVNDVTGMPTAAVMGGLHMGDFTGVEVDYVVRKLRKDHGMPELHLNHCTGEDAVTRMRQTLGLDGVKDLYAGMSVDFERVGKKILI